MRRSGLLVLSIALGCTPTPAATDAGSDAATIRDSSADTGAPLDGGAQPDAFADHDASTEDDADLDAWVGEDAEPLFAPPPRLIAPLSTATVSSQQPLLRWELAPGTDGARVEICADRNCTGIYDIFDATGTSARPTTPLRPGINFWRLYSRSGGRTAASVSASWELVVGEISAPVDTSYGSMVDVDGNGIADLAVGAPAASGGGRAYVYLGSSMAIGSTSVPATTLTGPDGGSFGVSIASAGDVNGDGYSDLVVGAIDHVYVYFGGFEGIETTPDVTLAPPALGGNFGYSVASAGDVDGDGYADVLVGAPNLSSNSGAAYVFHGSATGTETAPTTTLTAPTTGLAWFGVSVAGLGDTDGDGLAEIAVGAHRSDGARGRAYVFRGSSAGVITTPYANLLGPTTTAGLFGVAVANGGDVDADGQVELAVGGNDGHAYLFETSASGIPTTPTTTIVAPASASEFGSSIARLGDVDGDGYGDLLVGAPATMTQAGAVYVYRGGPSGLDTSTPTTIPGLDTNGQLGRWVSGGDLNGDGYADFVSGAWSGLSETGRVWLYSGREGGVPTVPSGSMPGPDMGRFGWSVAVAP